MGTHRTWVELGEQIVNHRWGKNFEGNIQDAIKTLIPEDSTRCIVAYAASIINDTPKQVKYLWKLKQLLIRRAHKEVAKREVKHGECDPFLKQGIVSAVLEHNNFLFSQWVGVRDAVVIGDEVVHAHWSYRPQCCYIVKFKPRMLSTSSREIYDSWMSRKVKQ